MSDTSNRKNPWLSERVNGNMKGKLYTTARSKGGVRKRHTSSERDKTNASLEALTVLYGTRIGLSLSYWAMCWIGGACYTAGWEPGHGSRRSLSGPIVVGNFERVTTCTVRRPAQQRHRPHRKTISSHEAQSGNLARQCFAFVFVLACPVGG